MRRFSFLLVFVLMASAFYGRAQQSAEPDLEPLRQAIADGEYPKIDGILMAQHGKLLVEEYFILILNSLVT